MRKCLDSTIKQRDDALAEVAQSNELVVDLRKQNTDLKRELTEAKREKARHETNAKKLAAKCAALQTELEALERAEGAVKYDAVRAAKKAKEDGKVAQKRIRSPTPTPWHIASLR